MRAKMLLVGKRDLGRPEDEWSLAVLQLPLMGFEMFPLLLGLENNYHLLGALFIGNC